MEFVDPQLEWIYLDPAFEKPEPETCHGRDQLQWARLRLDAERAQGCGSGSRSAVRLHSATIDPVGNVTGRYRSAIPGAKALIVGSHYDTVVNAGRYDGRLGILTALVIAEHLRRAGQALPFHLDIIAFAEEEGVRFSAPYIGSSAVAGRFDKALLQRRDTGGMSLADALRDAGGELQRVHDLGLATRPEAGARDAQPRMTVEHELHLGDAALGGALRLHDEPLVDRDPTGRGDDDRRGRRGGRGRALAEQLAQEVVRVLRGALALAVAQREVAAHRIAIAEELLAAAVAAVPDPAHDADRLIRIGKELAALSYDYRVTLDANEQYADLAGLSALVERLDRDAALRPIATKLLYIEQPMPRDITKASPLGVLARRDFIVDEADDSYDAFPVARALGYRGISSKSCKGIYKSSSTPRARPSGARAAKNASSPAKISSW